MIGRLVSAFLLSIAIGSVQADPLQLTSPPERATLVELFTSEGCSSCPRADRWLSTLKQDPRLWHEVVPVAFHVDYWDYLGWRDRFASPKYALRQRYYVGTGLASTVYTPGFMVNGREWRGWFGDPTLETRDAPAVGRLSLLVDGDAVTARFDPAQPLAGPLHLHLVVSGSELSTEVRAGENGGRKLRHDFVVLGYANQALPVSGAGFETHAKLPAVVQPATKRAISAWVTLGSDPRPLQSTGGWL